jgi:hypothetical protein
VAPSESDQQDQQQRPQKVSPLKSDRHQGQGTVIKILKGLREKGPAVVGIDPPGDCESLQERDTSNLIDQITGDLLFSGWTGTVSVLRAFRISGLVVLYFAFGNA